MDLGPPQRPPPSYNQAVALHPPGAPRTVSGSDTDVSTSAENLTHEEKYVLSYTERQDPQGEENLVKTALTGADFATPAGAMEWAKSVEKALKRPMGPPTGRPPPQYPRPGSAATAAAAAAAATAGQMPYNSLERLLGQRGVNGPPQVNGKEMKPPPAGGGGGAMSDKSNSSSSSQLAPAEGSSTGYDAGGASSGARSDKSPLSRSQPDLNRNGTGDPLRPPGQYREPPDYVAANAHEMMQILMQENSTLKQEIDMCQRKVQKLQKFARELEKLQSDYDDLVRTCQRREQLEYMARQKLTSEVRRATDLNNSLSSQLDTSKLDDDRKQTDRRELLIQQLVTQNKELQAVKERQEIELTAQRATLQEQRQYIDILDTALTKAQENVIRVEKEHSERLQTQYVERGTFVEQVAQLQRALTSCQLAADRREAAHKKIRADLEREVAELKAAVAGKQGDDSGSSRQAELADLRQKLRDANERILLLETELAHCQQKFVDSARENELMLERSLPPHLEPPPPLHQLTGGQSHASMEERVLGLEARLVEKDAMIRALQKHALEVPALMRSPHSRQSSLQALASINSSYGMGQHGYSSSAYSSGGSPARPPGSTNAGSMINMNRLHTVSSTPLSAEPRGAVSMASLSADISLLNASLASASLVSTPSTTAAPTTAAPAAAAPPPPAPPAASAAPAIPAAAALATPGAAPAAATAASTSAMDTGASILQALQKDREVFPEHYWHV